MKKLFLVVTFAAVLSAPLTASVFNFSLPWDDSSNTVTDLSYLNHKPAGVSGYVTAASDGHLYINGGASRIKFLGVNMTSSNCFPEHADADRIARRLAKSGINLVRFHLGDSDFGGSFIDYSYADTQHLSAANLDKFDYFFARLKANGVYSNINLLTGRDFKSGDGLPVSIDTMNWKDKQTPAMYDPVMINLENQYAYSMFNRVNPYTGLNYTNDPAFAFTETVNEHGLIHAWLNSRMDTLPSEFNSELQAMWDAYLQGKYTDFAGLQAAWGLSESMGAEKISNGDFASGSYNPWNLQVTSPAAASGSIVPSGIAPGVYCVSITVTATSPADWHTQIFQATDVTAGHPFSLSFSAKADRNVTIGVQVQESGGAWQTFFQRNISLTTSWQRYEFVFEPASTTLSARLNFYNMSPVAANYMLTQVSFRQGGVITGMNPGETDINSVKIFFKADQSARPIAALKDWVAFLWDKEQAFWGTMNSYLKGTLHIHALTIGTVVGNSTPNLMNIFDVIDGHEYWQHPSFSGAQWASPWYIQNSSELGQTDGSTISLLAMKRVAGKPFSVTEYNHPSPGTFDSETFPLLAAYASLQDWDAIYGYTYGDGTLDWSVSKLDGFFDIDMDPGKWANMLHAALMFRRGDVSAANSIVTVPLSQADELNFLPGSGPWNIIDATAAGMQKEAALLHRTAMVVDGGINPPGALPPSSVSIPGTHDFIADTGQLEWNAPAKALKIDSPMTKGIIGYTMGQSYNMGGVIIRPLSSMQSWASIMMSVAQGTSLVSGAQKILITATGISGNTGMNYTFYPSGTSAGFPPPADALINLSGGANPPAMGTGPTITEGIGAEFVIPYPAANVKFYALDNTGAQVISLPVLSESGNAKFRINDTYNTLWYEADIYAGPAPTDTFTMTPTMTQTPTFSITYTGTPTKMISPNATASATLTMTPTMTFSRTINPTATLTITVTVIPSQTPEKNLSKAYVYPSVFRPDSGLQGITFKRLGSYTRLQVYNLKGELVYSVSRKTPDGTLFWKIENTRKNYAVASGIYIYTISDASGNSNQGKLVVIK
jgi:hypothetical protein